MLSSKTCMDFGSAPPGGQAPVARSPFTPLNSGVWSRDSSSITRCGCRPAPASRGHATENINYRRTGWQSRPQTRYGCLNASDVGACPFAVRRSAGPGCRQRRIHNKLWWVACSLVKLPRSHAGCLAQSPLTLLTKLVLKCRRAGVQQQLLAYRRQARCALAASRRESLGRCKTVMCPQTRQIEAFRSLTCCTVVK